MEAPEARQTISWMHGAQGFPRSTSAGTGLDQPDRFRKFEGVQFGVHRESSVLSLESSVLSLQ